MDKTQIRAELEKRADEKYRKFSAGLLPGVNSILGVRLPELRKMAKQLARSDWRENLRQLSDDTFEEIMLQGIMIGCVSCPAEERLELIREFVPKIDNWSVCDSFCTGLKFVKSEKERVFSFLQPFFVSEKEFEQRFAAVILLDYYIDETWLSRTVKALEQINAKQYYAKMAVAWAMAECYLHFPDEVMPVLRQNRLDPEVRQKTLQKIIESRTISQDTREEIRAMKKQQ
ncbi:MAG: DNA alkylation repair protein [Lachnospiraceae bacterium]|jgi:3-methyladenine DNA glycosylase AlkD|nr:DNA alkylation repair protein [Lachnospiraceae bacterium]MCH4031763.1 DNA alkylation repair protein [Lachnospiraceae bacterium]MCH4108317.1 DNA alkylation repair protein [Lachnospiraceae bacterium]MCI1302635.1 DNA alkylation repair protein [Lachnospiraceae bacterium]MCI1331750.1 DNA alkylation repair protein [Lachnospiraceae bacterium]